MEKFEIILVGTKPKTNINPGEISMNTSLADLLAYWMRYPMNPKELQLFLDRVEQIVDPQLSDFMSFDKVKKISMLVRNLDYDYKTYHKGKLPTQLNLARNACERSIRSWINLYPSQSMMIDQLLQYSLTQETRQLALNKYWDITSYSRKNNWYFCLNIF